MRLPYLLPLFALISSALGASDTIYADTVSYCTTSRAIVINAFDIAYHRSNQSLTFALSLQATQAASVNARIYGQAYGIQVVDTTVNVCDVLSGALCPLPQINLTGYGTYPISSTYTSQIPSIAYSIPDLDAYARIELRDVNTNQIVSCVQASLSNGLTTRHQAIEIATGVFTLVALIVGLIHAILITSPSPAQYRWWDILFLYQTAAATGMLRLNYPNVYRAFTQNFYWAMALFYNRQVQSSINSMRARTGGYWPNNAGTNTSLISTSLTGGTDLNALLDALQSFQNSPLGSLFGRSSESSSEILTSRSIAVAPLQGLHSLVKKALPASPIGSSSDSYSGISTYVNARGIPTANAFDTIFFWFLAFIAIAIVVHILLFIVVWIFDRRNNGWGMRARRTWWNFCAGNALRICLIWFFPIWIFGFFQFKVRDSGLSIFFAVLSMVLTFVPLLVVFVLSILRSRRESSTAPGISPLYTSYRWFHSVGTLYRPYRQRYHFFWFAPLVLALIARAGFIAFGGTIEGWISVIGLTVVELFVLLSMLAVIPHKDKKSDWMGAFLSFCRFCTFGLLIGFIPAVPADGITRAIIGFVLIVLFGVQTILLFLGLIFNLGYGYWWRRHTYRVEDGLEVQRFVGAEKDLDNDSQRPMQHIDANNFVSAEQSRQSSVPQLHRRRSLMEPVDTVYEPSIRSRPFSTASASNGYGQRDSWGPNTTPRDSAYAYAEAAEGRGGAEGEYEYRQERQDRSRPGSRMSVPLSRRSGSGYSGNTQYYTPSNGVTSPVMTSPLEDARYSREGNHFADGRY